MSINYQATFYMNMAGSTFGAYQCIESANVDVDCFGKEFNTKKVIGKLRTFQYNLANLIKKAVKLEFSYNEDLFNGCKENISAINEALQKVVNVKAKEELLPEVRRVRLLALTLASIITNTSK